jgi:hypothetical protein
MPHLNLLDGGIDNIFFLLNNIIGIAPILQKIEKITD